MREFLNQHSFLLIGSFLLLLAIPLALRYAPRLWRWGAAGLLLLGLFGIHLALRTGDTELPAVEAVHAALAGGEPVLLELYSDY